MSILPCHANGSVGNLPDTIPAAAIRTPAEGIQGFSLQEGGIVRGDSTKKHIALIFTGDEYFEGFRSITSTLDKERVKGSFFLTGRLYRNAKARKEILSLHRRGHYMGPHSDMHLLYNDWSRRDSLLVSKDSMLNDLMANYAAMERLGIRESARFFIPPYEWWNRDVTEWCREHHITLFNFSPGTVTNADYTYPEMGKSYRSSDTLLQRLLAYESDRGLNGCMILVHIGTDPRRTDKFYERLPYLIRTLKEKGYVFKRVDVLLGSGTGPEK